MNAPSQLPQLPLEGAHFTPSPQYRRLFGNTPPAQVIGPPVDSFLDGQPCVPPPGLCDPSDAAGHSLAALLAEIAALRARHLAKGFTIERDAQHGPLWFWHVAHEFWWKAQDAGPDRDRRRKCKIAAAAMIIASIEADDFLARQQEEPADE